jgi:hypothetical protein
MGELMVVAMPVALALLAQTAAATNVDPAKAPTSTGPAAPPPKPASAATAASSESCSPKTPNADQIVICAERPQGYRLNPDVMEAKRQMRSGGRPVRQATEAPPPDCRTVGPAPCVSAGINLLAAAVTAAEMAKRIAAGQEIGSMFVTDPHPSEYQLYLQAKKRREALETEKAAKAKAKAAAAAAAQAKPPGQTSIPAQ